MLNNQDSTSSKTGSASQWSEEKYQKIENQLTGYWAQDVWNPSDNPYRDKSKKQLGGSIYFSKCPDQLKIEIKYACYQKLEKQEWKWTTLHYTAARINRIIEWLSKVAENNQFLHDRDLNEWLLSLRSYLVDQGKYKAYTRPRRVNTKGELKKYREEDPCIYVFKEIYECIQDCYDIREEYDKDVWNLRKLGFVVFSTSNAYLLNFTKIIQPWIQSAAKRFIKYKLALVAPATCHRKLNTSLRRFSQFVAVTCPSLEASQINRATIVDYIEYLANLEIGKDSCHSSLADLNDFLELCYREGWAEVTGNQLIYNDDYPKYSRKRHPKYIPEEVLEQIKSNLLELKNPVHRRMFLILVEGGLRIGELITIPFDCLKQDISGGFFLQYYQSKMKKDLTIPLSPQTVAVIQEQQNYVRSKWNDSCLLLFPSSIRENKPMHVSPFCDSLKKLLYEKDIRDVNGKYWNFHPHQCRHTVGTSMINNGVPQHIVQRFLGHESPTMTQVYAHIHDETLRRELEKYHETRVVNIVGQVVELERSSVGDEEDLEWFRKTVLAMALPHGWCGRPKVLGHCNLPPNSCLNCAHLRTNKNFLEVFKDELKRTNEILAKAKKYGWEVQVKMNEPIKVNLERMIAALETDD